MFLIVTVHLKTYFNHLLPKSNKDFTLSIARRFYSSKGDPLGVKGLTLESSRQCF